MWGYIVKRIIRIVILDDLGDWLVFALLIVALLSGSLGWRP